MNGTRRRDTRVTNTALTSRSAHAHDIVPPTEAFSFWTHAAGGVVALAGFLFLVSRAGDSVARVAFGVYGVSLVFLFTSSALHHVPWVRSHTTVSTFRRLDHIAIFGLIAGTYTPICLLALEPQYGIPLLALVWGVGAVGMIVKVFRPLWPRWVSVGTYIAMGWMCALALPWVLDAITLHGFGLLLAGGVTYTVGAIVYGTRRPDPLPHFVGFHGIWHLFVLAGAAFHYAAVLGYVPTSSPWG